MQLLEVTDKAAEREFIRLPWTIYQDDPAWIPHLKQDIRKVFDPDRNKYFKEGEAVRWILVRDGSTVGRIAAFVHHKLSKGFEQPTGGIGFFECIDEQACADLLFDRAKHWLASKGMEAMDGPINFGEKDNFWGLLVASETEPMYGMSYNPPYYRELFEQYGFKNYYEQYNYLYDIQHHAVPDHFTRKARALEADPDYEFGHVRDRNYEKYAEDFRTVYNNAWAKGHFNFKPMSKDVARMIMKKLKPIADPRLMYFGWHKGRAIGMFIMIPELNQLFRYVNGNLNWWGKIKFLWHLKFRKSCRKAMGIVFGVDPEYQGLGVEAAIIKSVEYCLRGDYRQYDTMEMQWIAEFNPKMIHVVEALEVPRSKTRVTYRYLFDRGKEFTRHPVVGSDA
jgi:GNAT superfamily N-acetyltransferase